MSKILRFLTCLFCIVFIGDAVFAAGYECPTYRQYTTCNEGYYLAYSYTGTSYSDIRFSSTPRAGNACRPCTDYDNYYDRPEGSYYCEGGKKAPVLNKVTITYKLNGGSGTTPDSELCTKGQPCTLNDGATNTFYRAGYVFKGWSKSKSATTGSTSLTFTANTTVYAVWEPCGVGKYKEGSENADAECSACPEPLDGFVFDTGVIIATLPEECSIYAYDLHPLNEWCASTPDDTSKQLLYALWGSDDTWHVFTNALAISVVPGAYANPPGGSLPPQPGVEIESFDDLCLPCGIGKYSEGGDVTSCSACPQPTDGFEYVPTTGNTSLTACKQGLKNPADINEFCEAASGTTAEELKIQCWAASDGTWGDCIRTGFPFDAKPGCYVGIPSQSQSMPVEDVVENICIQCTDGTYSEGGGATSCSACPALTTADERDGWKISSGGDGATSPQDCYAYLESYPTNCASGSFKRMLLGAAGYYGSEWFELEPLKAEPGYIVQFEDGQTTAPACVECSVGTYSPGGAVRACTACPTPELENADEWDIATYGKGATSLSQCYAFLDVFGKPEGEGCMQGFIRIDMGSDGTYDIENAEAMGFAAEPGYYLTGAGLDARCEICAAGTYSEGHGATECTECSAGTYSSEPGASGCTDCPLPIQYAGVMTIWESIEKPLDGIDKCSLVFLFNPDTVEMLPDNMGKDAQNAIFCKYCDGDYGVSDTCGNSCGVLDQINFHCAPGYYQNMSPDDFGKKYTLLNMEDWFDKCAAPGVDYWADGTSRYQCPTGLTTIGYGAGADEAADCGRVLHFGNDTLYLRSVKKTDHALHVGINGTVFYGNMGTDLSKGSLRIKLGDTTYSVYDDSM